MSFFGWFENRWSRRVQAMALYRRGMAKAKLHNHRAALADYTAVIEMADAPADVRAMALYNRSVAHAAGHNNAGAIGDLEALLDLPGAAANVKLEAHRKLVRMRRTADRGDERLIKPES